MKSKYLIFFLIVLLSGCFEQDPLFEIKRMARDPKKKEEAVKEYERVINTLVDAYSSYGGLNKELGEKLMFKREFEKAIFHLEKAKSIYTQDGEIYYWLGVCHVNLANANLDDNDIFIAEDYYKKAIQLIPEHGELLYSYAHLLFYKKDDYVEAKSILEKYTSLKKHQTPDGYFLLGRTYYMLGDFINARITYETIRTKFQDVLTVQQRNAIDDALSKINKEIVHE